LTIEVFNDVVFEILGNQDLEINHFPVPFIVLIHLIINSHLTAFIAESVLLSAFSLLIHFDTRRFTVQSVTNLTESSNVLSVPVIFKAELTV